MASYIGMPIIYRGGALLQTVSSQIGQFVDSGKMNVLLAITITGIVSASMFPSLQQRNASSQNIIIADACISSSSIANENTVLPYETITIQDPTAPAGTARIQTAGTTGIMTTTYKIISNAPSGCAKDEKIFIKQTVASEPINQVIIVGTRVAQTETAASCAPDDAESCALASPITTCGDGNISGFACE